MSPEPSLGVQNRHVEEEGETWRWDAAEQGGGGYGAEKKKSPGIAQLCEESLGCRYRGLPGPFHSFHANKMLEEWRGGGLARGGGA